MNCYIGCLTTNRVTRKTYDEFDKTKRDKPIIVMSYDSTEYYFEPLTYNFFNNKIIGTAKIIDESKYKTVNLASSEILSIGAVEKVRKRLTTMEIILGGVVLVGATIGFAYLLAKGMAEKGLDLSGKD
jgi:hypothetical protein